MGHRIYVGNIPFGADESSLRGYFEGGESGRRVTRVRIITDRKTGKPRGFAFVEFEREGHAREAIARFAGADMGGRKIVVNEAHEQRVGEAGRPRVTGGGGGSMASAPQALSRDE